MEGTEKMRIQNLKRYIHKNSLCDFLVKQQEIIFRFEQFVCQKTMGIEFVLLAIALLFSILTKVQAILGNALVIVMFICYVKKISKWYISVVKFILTVVIWEFIFCFFIMLGIKEFIKFSDITTFIIIFIIYLAIWFVFSILAKSDVSKLANEFISVITTIIFTIGTYVVSMKYGDVPSLVQKMNGPFFIDSLKKVIFETGFLILLPVLSVSLFCTLAVDIKDYYFKKCNRKEFWEEGYLEIQKQDKQEQKQ